MFSHSLVQAGFLLAGSSERVLSRQHKVPRRPIRATAKVLVQRADVLLVEQVVQRAGGRPLRRQLIAGHQVYGGVVALLDLGRGRQLPIAYRHVDAALPVHAAANGQAVQLTGQAVGGPDLHHVGRDDGFDALVIGVLDHAVAVAGVEVPVWQQFAADFHVDAAGLGLFRCIGGDEVVAGDRAVGDGVVFQVHFEQRDGGVQAAVVVVTL